MTNRSITQSRGPRFAVAFGLGVVLGAVLSAEPAAAHTQPGSLGVGAAATDAYQVICSDDGAGPPASLSIQVLDGTPVAAPLVSVQVKNGLELVSSTDPVDGDTTPSPLVSVNADAGTVFEVLVDKAGAGAENYVLTFHCVTGPDGSGLHTGTDVIARQNQ